MFSRQATCDLTGISVEQFKTLARRDQLPITLTPNPSTRAVWESAGERGWNRFTSFEVFKIAVFERLLSEIGYADGLGTQTALKIVDNGGMLADVFEMCRNCNGVPKRADIWIGYLGIANDKSSRNVGGRNLAGVLKDILSSVQKEAVEPFSPARLFLVNVSAVMRAVLIRSEKLKIAFLSD
jgi:hypothetical protein